MEKDEGLQPNGFMAMRFLSEMLQASKNDDDIGSIDDGEGNDDVESICILGEGGMKRLFNGWERYLMIVCFH